MRDWLGGARLASHLSASLGPDCMLHDPPFAPFTYLTEPFLAEYTGLCSTIEGEHISDLGHIWNGVGTFRHDMYCCILN